MAGREVPGLRPRDAVYVVTLPGGSVVPVDQGDVDAAKLSIELAREDGVPVDPALEAIANAALIAISTVDSAGTDDRIAGEEIPDAKVSNVRVRDVRAKKQPKSSVRTLKSRSAVSGSYGAGAKSIRSQQRNPK